MNANPSSHGYQRGDVSKWEEHFERFSAWNTERQKMVQEEEAELIISWLQELGLPNYDLLEIGCGNGRVARRVIEVLDRSGTPFTYQVTDLIPRCVAVARETLGAYAQDPRVSFRVLDAYAADAELGVGTQTIILSTGFASAATHPQALPVVADLLKDGGILIADFVNHLSASIWLPHPLRSLERFFGYKSGKGKSYHFGLLGLQTAFMRYGLRLIKHRSIRFRRNPIVCMFRKG